MPKLQRLNNTATPQDVTEVLQADGAVIVEKIIDSNLLAQAEQECRPFIDATPMGKDGFSGYKTTRTGALVSRSAACREIILNPLILETAETWLKPFAEKVQLNLSQIIRILPGQEAQPIHRDRWAWGTMIPQEIEVECNTMWALNDFTAAKGGTCVVPGSHLWEPDRLPEPHEVVQAEMPAGSVLVYTGTVFHGGGPNTSAEERLGFNVDYVVGWLRQEENQYLTCPPEVAKTLDPKLTDLLGYTMGNYVLGYFSVPESADAEGAGVCPPEVALGRAPSGPGAGLEGMDIPEGSDVTSFA
ncbi:MAG: phytanoyl-CoA dioxygenase family protein [Alphaproteobacteria bacterium]